MKKHTTLWLTLVCVFFTVTSTSAYRYQYHQANTDLFFLYYGFSQHNWVSVDGNAASLKDGNLRLSEDYSHDERASLMVNGQMFGALKVNLSAVYDTRLRYYPGNRDQSDFRFQMGLGMTDAYKKAHPLGDGWNLETRANYQGDMDWRYQDTDKRLLTEPFADLKLELFAKLSYKRQWLAVGDQQVSLENTQFTLSNRNLLAARLHLESSNRPEPMVGRVHFDGLAAKVKGITFSEGGSADTTGIRADGGSGPYYLSYAPLTRGSELVRIETRDRYNPEIIISSNVQRRGEDYTIDYERGLIIFEDPIPAEDFSGNPIYIVIQYDYEYNNEGDYNRYLTGGQMRLDIGQDSYVGVNYVKEFDDEDSWEWSGSYRDALEAQADTLNIPVDSLWQNQTQPPTTDHTVRSVNSQVTFGQTVLRAEIAESDFEPFADSDDDENMALRADIESYLRPGIKFESSYWRVDRQYKAIGNPNLDIDKEKWRVFGDYEYQDYQFLTAEYRHDRNIDYDDSTNVSNDRIVRFGWREEIPDIPHIRLMVEQREQYTAFDTEDKERRTITGELKHQLLGKTLGVTVGHEYERFNNKLEEAENTNRHATRAGLDWRYHTSLAVRLQQRVEFRQNRQTDLYESREDRTRLGVQWQPILPLKTDLTYDYRRTSEGFEDLSLTNDADRTDRTFSGQLTVEPSSRLLNKLKYENRQAEDHQAEQRTESTKQLLRDQMIVYFTPDLHLNLVGELEDLEEWKTGVYNQTLLKRALAELNYHIFAKLDAFVGYEWREWEDDRFASSKSRTQRALFGARYYFLPMLYGRVQLRHASTELLGDVQADPMTQQLVTLEAGTDIKMHFRGAIGTEFVTYEDENYPANDYDANRIYGKLMVKF